MIQLSLINSHTWSYMYIFTLLTIEGCLPADSFAYDSEISSASFALRNHHNSSLLDYDIRYTFKKWCFTICKHAHFRHPTPSCNIAIPESFKNFWHLSPPKSSPPKKPRPFGVATKTHGILGPKLRILPTGSQAAVGIGASLRDWMRCAAADLDLDPVTMTGRASVLGGKDGRWRPPHGYPPGGGRVAAIFRRFHKGDCFFFFFGREKIKNSRGGGGKIEGFFCWSIGCINGGWHFLNWMECHYSMKEIRGQKISGLFRWMKSAKTIYPPENLTNVRQKIDGWFRWNLLLINALFGDIGFIFLGVGGLR